jgi:O-antigen/teichoic acid export membrane protein
MTLAAGASEIAARKRERRTRSLRGALTRLATVGDQLLVALTNFGLTIAIGRAFGADDLAAYGIGLSVGLVVQGLQRHAITIPLMLCTAAWAKGNMGRIAAEQLLVLSLALLAGMLALVFSYFSLPRFLYLATLSSAVCLFIYLQLEFARAFLVKIGKPLLLLFGAASYTLAAAGLSICALRGLIGYETMLGGLAATLLTHAAVVTYLAGKPVPREGARLFAADTKQYGGWAAAATATYAGYNHVPLLILGAIAAPVHTAVFVAARSLLQPLQILLRGFDVADKTLFAELRDGDRSGRFIWKRVALYALIGVLFGAAAGFGAERLLTLAYGQKFAGYGAAIIAWAPAYVLLSVSMPLESLVYAQKRFAAYFLIRGIASVLAIAAAFPLIHWYAEVGAIAACGIGWFIAVMGTAVMLARRGAAQ